MHPRRPFHITPHPAAPRHPPRHTHNRFGFDESNPYESRARKRRAHKKPAGCATTKPARTRETGNDGDGITERVGARYCALMGYIQGWGRKRGTMDAPHPTAQSARMGRFFMSANSLRHGFAVTPPSGREADFWPPLRGGCHEVTGGVWARRAAKKPMVAADGALGRMVIYRCGAVLRARSRTSRAPSPPCVGRAWQKARISARCASQPRESCFRME